MKKFYHSLILVILFLTGFVGMKAADYPTLYVVGAFQNWDLTSPKKVNANDAGVYSFTMNIGDLGTFKMTFSGTSDWAEFDRQSVGTGSTETWKEGIYPLVAQLSNSQLPAGSWVITVYYNEMCVAMSAPGKEVPLPGEIKPTPGTAPSGTLPVLYINVYDDNGNLDNEVIDYNLSHKNYFSGKYWLDVNGCEWLAELGAKSVGSKDEPLDLQIKARGNYTRTGFSKKPFKLKLDKKQSLLGLSKSKHFAILAHADDEYGFLRNFVGFELGKRIGLPWTPSQQPVEVVINGNYRGLYFLTESIRIDEDRVNIVEGKDNELSNENISGGYIVELDNYDEDDDAQIRMDELSCAPGHYLDRLRITFDTPEVYSDLQRRFVSEQFTAINYNIGNNNDDIWKYIDLDDAARYYLVKEIISDTEAYHGSTYLFRDLGPGQKWHFSPLWDFGNGFNGATDDFFYNCDPFGNTWIPSLRRNHKFNNKVIETWLWFMSNNYDGLEDDIYEYIDHIKEAAEFDNARWTAGNIPQKSKGSSNIENRRDRALRNLADKTAWLARQFGNYNMATFTEPERDDTEAAPLPDYAKTGVGDIAVDNAVSTPWYYNLQGQPVSNPVKGQLYITSDGVIRY